jgi:chitinase
MLRLTKSSHNREYPVAEDRSGREVDFDNFPKFMARLKETLSGASKGLTITLPASYWYLKHFDLVNLVCSPDTAVKRADLTLS